MNHFFRHTCDGDPLQAKRSDFVMYNAEGPEQEVPAGSGEGNVHKRMIEFWKYISILAAGAEGSRRERSRRHRMNERMRREKHKLSYLTLHSLLPLETKSDHNSIIQGAAREVGELLQWKQGLERRNEELERARLWMRRREGGAPGEGSSGRANIRVWVGHPSSGIDSMLEVLQCLKSTGSHAKAFYSQFSPQEFSAQLEVQTQIEAEEVKKAVQRSLFEVERKLRFQNPLEKD